MCFIVNLVDGKLHIFLVLKDMDRMRIYDDSFVDKVVHHTSKTSLAVKREFWQTDIRWNPIAECLYTITKLQRLQRRFVHPSARKLHSFH